MQQLLIQNKLNLSLKSLHQGLVACYNSQASFSGRYCLLAALFIKTILCRPFLLNIVAITKIKIKILS